MFNTYFISPVRYQNSIYLAYDDGQPCASFGSKTLAPGMPSVCLPSAPPQDNQPHALVTEFLRLCPISGIRPWSNDSEAGPRGKRKNLYRIDPRSQYAAPVLGITGIGWETATVFFEGKPALMLWSYGEPRRNCLATKLGRQVDTELPAFRSRSNFTVRGVAYLVLRQMWKPVVDIRTMKYPRASDFEREVRPLIKGWWHAVKIDNGWRLYADDKDQLMWAKLKIDS